MFKGFEAATFKFFRSIERNNRREWFLDHKQPYIDKVVTPAQELVAELNQESALRKLGLKRDPKKALFRLNRDIRFSANKSPYKNYNGISLSRSGARGDSGVLYLHIQPKECFVAAGFWQPDPKLVTRFRLWMVENPREFKKMIQNLRKSRLNLSHEDSLKRLPRGFENTEDKNLKPYLMLKSYLVSKDLSELAMCKKTLVKEVTNFATASAPLLKSGWKILDKWRDEGGDEEYQERLLNRTTA